MRTVQVNKRHSETLVLAVSLELAVAKWKVALPDGRVHTVAEPQAASRLQT
ncbi:transposase [Paraburkholderia fungorum]|uniref:Transposase n=1 Tax=Paraburkholderia fungorum TaxID=134537 RepID=A0A1H1HFV8_9BURK|nr:transposase [Paraburkholderia fungorum]